MLITVGRNCAAGGSEVARLTAEKLGWSLVDDAFVFRVAERAGMTLEEVASGEERVPSFVERFARSTALASPELFLAAGSDLGEFPGEKIVRITRKLVVELAAEGKMVLVGRASPAMIAHDTECIHARIVAPRDFRIERAITAHGIDRAKAAAYTDERDSNRRRYLREYFDMDWDDPTNYDMVLNTATLGFEGAADLIVAWARNLGW